MTAESWSQMTLTIDGLGIVLYAPSSATHITEGADYFSSHFMDAEDVQRHVQEGTIVPFATSSPGTYLLRFHPGYPTPDAAAGADFSLRLAVRSDGTLVFRDLYDLMEWTADHPADQAIALPVGIHHVTLLSDRPASGILGDDQAVDVFLQPLDTFPALARDGIPTLCW